MKIIADTHCHTIASTHAYSTIEEMIRAAKYANLYAIAITDHAHTMPGSPGKWYFENLVVLPLKIDGVLVIKGVEANVVDYDGNLDINRSILESVDWVIASMHEVTLRNPVSIEESTNAWLQIAKNPRVNVIGHSGVEAFKFDYERVIPEFGSNGKLVEINNSSFRVRPTAKPNCRKIAELCKKYEVPVIVNSDAHVSYQVGDVNKSLDFLNEINFPEELIVNSSIERFEEYLKKFTHILEDSCIATKR